MSTYYKTTKEADEIAYLLNEQLRSKKVEKSAVAFQKSFDCLSKAASILEDLNEKKASEAITVLMETIVGK